MAKLFRAWLIIYKGALHPRNYCAALRAARIRW